MSDKEMAPAVVAHLGARPIRSDLMDITSVADVLCTGSRTIYPSPPSASIRTSLLAQQPVGIG